MIDYNRYSWWPTVFSFRGTALLRASGRILLFVAYSAIVQFVTEFGEARGWFGEASSYGIDPVGHAVVGSLLGFLIVFRMNASNSRYWEGRSHWGQIINCSRNLVRVGSEYTQDGDELAQLVSGYVICLRRSLQGQRDTKEADDHLSPEVCRDVERFGNTPTGVSAYITEWIARHHRTGELDSQLVRHMEDLLAKIVDSQGGCEKIQKTPLPFVYVAMIKQLIVVYLVTLEFVLFHRCGWWSPLLMGVVALGLFGMEEASVETEDPFGTDENCLEMDAFTLTIARDAGQLVARARRRLPVVQQMENGRPTFAQTE